MVDDFHGNASRFRFVEGAEGIEESHKNGSGSVGWTAKFERRVFFVTMATET
jgi:hypothetical protein